MSSVEEVLKKESKKEYTNRAERAFIDFPIGVSTNYSSEFTVLIFAVFFARHIIEEPCTPEEVCEADERTKIELLFWKNRCN